MSFRTTAILIAVLAVLGAGVYFLEYRPNPEPSGLDPKLQIWKFDDKTVQRVAVRWGDTEQVMEQRPDGLWYLEPQNARADYWRISGTLVRLANLRASRRVTDNPRDLATYGLDAPRGSLTLRTPDGRDHTLLIGEKGPTDAGYYAKQPGDNTVWLVGTFNVDDIEGFVTRPAFEPTPVPSITPSPAPVGGTPATVDTPAPVATNTPVATPGAIPGLPTLGVPGTPRP
jgi:hypothetical protein